MDTFNAYATYLIKQHYDASLEDHLTMYDNLPYERDYDMCNGALLVSGNIIKFFRCTQTEPFTVSNRDNEVDKIIQKHLSDAVQQPSSSSISLNKEMEVDEDENANDM